MPNSENPEPIDLSKIVTYELASRPSKVTVADFGRPTNDGATVDDLVESLPKVLAAENLRAVADAVRRARDAGKPVIWGIGGHVVKTGLSPVIIDLMERGFVTAIASNGSVLVHDAEIALAGFTSEDVDASLGDGDFGAARETGEVINTAAGRASATGIGLGAALGRELAVLDPPYKRFSLLCAADRLSVPFTAHLTIGADIGHFHPGADGAALGAASHLDFRVFCTLVRAMNGGGVYLNVGSAVTLPEIFLKAVTVVRNLGHELRGITTVNFDFIQHYRPLTNVVRRPTANGDGRGYAITGHHEIIVPLLAAMLRKE
jgi:hypothetical protein